MFFQFNRALRLALVSIALWSHAVSAQQQQAPGTQNLAIKMAVIDMDAIRDKSKAVRDLRQQIAKFRNTFQSQIQSEEQELRKADKELARQRAILSPEAFNDERKKFVGKVQTLGRKVDGLKRELAKAENQGMRQVKEALTDIIKNIATEFNFTLILRKDQTVLAASALDITPLVLSRLDKALPTVTVNQPALPPAAPAPGR